ncbi:type IV toxin-antitoxin system AbiEi family antitoxin domain-containing protein [Mycobacteroides sp. LB1]|nr:type IV toxin-antitoxin system AbiEi family antitoxin domain-containing protein [Mycobacteroides sp. LB1]
MTYRHELWRIAAERHGIVTTEQAEDWGVPAVEMRKLATRGALTRVGRGVYRHNGVPHDAWTDLAGALASVGPDAFLEGHTVLAMFDLALVNPPKIYVGTPRRHRGAVPPHTVVTARPHMAPEDLTEYEGLRSLTVRRALLDAVQIILSDRMQDAVVNAQRRDLITELEAKEIVGAVAGWDQRMAAPSSHRR